jgi:hypothetical protein
MLELKIKLLRSNALSGLAAAPDLGRHDGCSAGLGSARAGDLDIIKRVSGLN